MNTAAAISHVHFAQLPREIIESDLPNHAFRVLARMMLFYSKSQTVVFIKQEETAKAIHMCDRHLRRGLKVLLERGLIKETGEKKSGLYKCYSIHLENLKQEEPPNSVIEPAGEVEIKSVLPQIVEKFVKTHSVTEIEKQKKNLEAAKEAGQVIRNEKAWLNAAVKNSYDPSSSSEQTRPQIEPPKYPLFKDLPPPRPTEKGPTFKEKLKPFGTLEKLFTKAQLKEIHVRSLAFTREVLGQKVVISETTTTKRIFVRASFQKHVLLALKAKNNPPEQHKGGSPHASPPALRSRPF